MKVTGSYIITIRDIAAGEELTYDYCLYDGDDDDPAPCYCGSQTCRGSMYSPAELKKLARKKRPRLQDRSRKEPSCGERRTARQAGMNLAQRDGTRCTFRPQHRLECAR